MIRTMFLAALLAVAQAASAQIPVMDPPVTVVAPDELTKSQLNAIVKKASERKEVECLNRYTAQAALAGAIAGNLATRPGSLLKTGPLLGLAIIFRLGSNVYDAIVESKIRAECAAAGAASGLAVSYWYFQRLYRTTPAASASPPAASASPPAALPDLPVFVPD